MVSTWNWSKLRASLEKSTEPMFPTVSFDLISTVDLAGFDLYDSFPQVTAGQVAQLVEHATENRGVGSSTLPLPILPKLNHRKQIPLLPTLGSAA
jgi:hypothetical protein